MVSFAVFSDCGKQKPKNFAIFGLCINYVSGINSARLVVYY